MQPVVTIFNKPISDNSGIFESNKHILSEGRADQIGKRFTFENGNIKPKADEMAFHSVTICQKPLFATILEEKKDQDIEIQKRKFSNHMEYNLSHSSVGSFPRNVDSKRPTIKLELVKEENASPTAYNLDMFAQKPTEDDLGTVKLRISN